MDYDSESEDVDTISLALRNKSYELKVVGNRKEVKQHTVLFVNHIESFDRVVHCLTNYYMDCLMMMQRPENKQSRKGAVYHGAGSDRGDWFKPWTVEWKLELNCQFPRYQEENLKNIVNAHNWHVRALVELEKMQLENKLTATHRIL